MISSCDYECNSLNGLELGLPKLFVNLDMKHDFVGKEALKKKRDAALAKMVHLTDEERDATMALRNPGADRLMCGVEFLDDSNDAASWRPDPPQTGMWAIEDAN